ncbi:MAG: dihydrodipicolinate synthase family protein [Desulfobacterales bacterium]|jgi:4-hydroxy-tetrahydrodipicolinate synthase
MPDFILSGVFAASLTPLTKELNPDADRLIGHANWLFENGCDGVAILGTTGEANSFSLKQRLELIAEVTRELPSDKMMIGTGCCAVADTLSLTRAVLAGGCGNVLMLPTFYYKNQSDDSVYATFAEVIERIGDARLSVFLYHFPQMSGTPISIEVVGRLIKDYPDTVVGLKDSSGEWEENTSLLLRHFPGFATFAGSEQFLLKDLLAGGPGCISATVNVTAPMAKTVIDLWRAGTDTAQEAQKELIRVRQVLQKFPVIAALKFLTARRTGDTEWLNILLPHLNLSEKHRQLLLTALAETEFFNRVTAFAV